MNELVETPFHSEAEFLAALDLVIANASREIRLFDQDLACMKLNDKGRAERLAQFLSASPTRRLYVVLHRDEHVAKHCPRLRNLISRFPNAIEVRETSAELKHVADSFLLADQAHGVIRFHHDHARGKLLQFTADTIRPWWQRFDELWRHAAPCLAPTQVGL